MEICAVPAELLHADGRTNNTKLIVTFRNLRRSLKRDIYYYR